MDKKIVFFDIDGTLLDEEKNLPISTKKAIKQLQADGVYTAIATGRAPFMVTSLLKELNMNSFISFNGQYVVFEGNVIYTNPLELNALTRLQVKAKENNHSVVYMNETTLKSNVKYDERIERSLSSLQMPHPECDPNFLQKHEIYQTLLFARENETEYLAEFEEIQTFIRWHEDALDVVPKGGSKAEGIKKIIEMLEIKMENVYAFGDGLNDIEMLETVGTGIAMGNAHDVVKGYADMVTADVEDSGIAKGLIEVGLLTREFELI